MNLEEFRQVSSSDLANRLVAQARERVILALPGIHEVLGVALREAHGRLPGRVVVILDPTEMVFRLGLGDFTAMEALQACGVPLLRREGLRLGCVVVDDVALFVAPTAPLIEGEPIPGAYWINAVPVTPEAAEQFLFAIADSTELQVALKGPKHAVPVIEPKAPPVARQEITVVDLALKEAPPANFELARQTMVFQPHLQYVDLEVRGCNVSRRKISIPEEVLPMAQRGQIQTKLEHTMTLFGNGVEQAFFPVQNRVKAVRKKLIKSLGDPYGNVILKSDRKRLDEAIVAIHDELEILRKELSEGLQEKLDESMENLIKLCRPMVQANPPDALKMYGTKLTEQRVEDFVRGYLESSWPTATELLGEMKLSCVIREFTFDTLDSHDFLKRLKKAFPDRDWDKPYQAAMAVTAKEA